MHAHVESCPWRCVECRHHEACEVFAKDLEAYTIIIIV